MARYGIYSCEGFAREVLPSLRRQHDAATVDVVFIDDDGAVLIQIVVTGDLVVRPAGRFSVPRVVVLIYR